MFMESLRRTWQDKNWRNYVIIIVGSSLLADVLWDVPLLHAQALFTPSKYLPALAHDMQLSLLVAAVFLLLIPLVKAWRRRQAAAPP